MNEPLSKRIRFGITPTYRCNWACRMCNRWLDKFPWQQPSDLTAEQVAAAGDLVLQSGITINKVRVTGGEPTLHPELFQICENIRDHWKPERMTAVLTNGSTEDTRPKNVWARYKADTTGGKKLHRPWAISPADLGLEGSYGTVFPCEVQRGCGRGFDAYGFAPCALAGSLGRLLRIDPYSALPLLMGDRRMCSHCLFSLSRRDRWRVWGQVDRGQLKWPTRTYREAEQAFGLLPFRFATWEERR